MLQLLTILKAILDFWNEASNVNDPDLSPRDKKRRMYFTYIAFFVTSSAYLGYLVLKDRLHGQTRYQHQYEVQLETLRKENERLSRIIQSKGQSESPFSESPSSSDYRDRLRERFDKQDPS